MSIYLFCEGQTEKNIVEKLATLANPNFEGKGKTQVNKQMVQTIGPLLNQSKAIRTLIMRDVDEGETSESIVQSVTGKVQDMLNERDLSETVQFQRSREYSNVYVLTLSNPDLRLALHLATYKWNAAFVNATIDDYVLDLALRQATATAFLRQKQWKTTCEQIIRKVTDRIPALLQENEIPLREAKDYVRLYAAVIQVHTSPAIFAQKTLAHAKKEDRQAVFAPLLAALNFLGERQP